MQFARNGSNICERRLSNLNKQRCFIWNKSAAIDSLASFNIQQFMDFSWRNIVYIFLGEKYIYFSQPIYLKLNCCVHCPSKICAHTTQERSSAEISASVLVIDFWNFVQLIYNEFYICTIVVKKWRESDVLTRKWLNKLQMVFYIKEIQQIKWLPNAGNLSDDLYWDSQWHHLRNYHLYWRFFKDIIFHK